jgi:hypothetical protein
MAWAIPGLFNDLLSSNTENARRLKTEDGSTAYDEGRLFRTQYDILSGETLPLVIKFEISTNINLLSALQDVHDGSMRYRVFSSGIEGGTFTPITVYRANNKTGVPIVDSGLTVSAGGTLDVTGITPIDISYIRTAGASGQTSTVEGLQSRMRGFPPTTAYVVVDQIPTSNKAPEGVLKYEWSID